VGVHRNFIGSLERGERNPTLVSVERVATALGAEPFEMLRGWGSLSAPSKS